MQSKSVDKYNYIISQNNGSLDRYLQKMQCSKLQLLFKMIETRNCVMMINCDLRNNTIYYTILSFIKSRQHVERTLKCIMLVQ